MSLCFNCGYFWKEDDEKLPRCHFEGPVGWAPCEADEDDIEPYDNYIDYEEE